MPKKPKSSSPEPVGATSIPEVAPAPPVSNIAVIDVTTPQKLLNFLLQNKKIELTEVEQQKMDIYKQAQNVLGVAASAPMKCAGEHCPVAGTCLLFEMHKAPIGDICPIEADYVSEKFVDWTKDLGKGIADLTATEKSDIAELVVMDVQERRCTLIMAEGKAASMTDLSVKEVDLQTGEALSYEQKVHANQEIIQEIRTARRMKLDDMEKTEKAKTRKLKAYQGKNGNDLSTRQSAIADQVRNAIADIEV